MSRVMRAVAPYLHLARVTTAFAAVGNVWLVILWSRSLGSEEVGGAAFAARPLWLLLGGGAACGLGLYAFGASLNDLLDARQDRAFRRSRPLASGVVGASGGVAAVVGSLMIGVLGGLVFGTTGVVLTLVCGVGIFVYNAAGKFVPGVGIVLLGVVASVMMLIPNPRLGFLWPVVVALTQTVGVALVRHHVGRRVPTISRRALVSIVGGWASGVGVLLWLMVRRTGHIWPAYVSVHGAVLVVVLAVIFVWYVRRRLRRTGAGERAAEKVMRYGSLWMGLYALGWLGGSWMGGAPLGSATLVMALLVACGVLGMTVLREWYSLLEHPAGFRLRP